MFSAPFQAVGQAGQRVHLAAQAFSNTVGTAMATYLPRRGAQASAILTMDKWFDVMNSRRPYDTKLERCGFGVSRDASAAQEGALEAAEALISSARKYSSVTDKVRSGLLPFQEGILRCTRSLRGLLTDLRCSVFQGDGLYLLTSRLNQDCVENFFSQLRGACGPNQMPDAAEARARMRMLLIARAPLVAASSSGR